MGVELLEQKRRLNKILKAKEDQLSNLSKVGWIEEYLAKRGIDNPQILSNLKLQGVDPLTYFDRLVNHVRPLQSKIKEISIPNLKIKIWRIDNILRDGRITTYPESDKSKVNIGRFNDINLGRLYAFMFFCKDHKRYGENIISIPKEIAVGEILKFIDHQLTDRGCSDLCKKTLTDVQPISPVAQDTRFNNRYSLPSTPSDRLQD